VEGEALLESSSLGKINEEDDRNLRGRETGGKGKTEAALRHKRRKIKGRGV